jgi:hypothetical protein
VAQSRVFWACQAVLFIERNDKITNIADLSAATFLTGVQSVGVDGSLPSITLPDLGRFQRKGDWKFDSKQREFSITIDRLINKGDNTFYKTATYNSNYATTHILNEYNIGVQGELNSNNKSLKNYDIIIIYGPDDQARLDTNNTLQNVVYENCLITNLSYSFSVDGGLRESITLTSKHAYYGANDAGLSLPVESAPQSGNTIKRQDLDWTRTQLPDEAENIFKDAVTDTVNGQLVYGVQSIDINVTIDYLELNDVGVWRGAEDNGEDNVWKFVSVPISVTSSFTGVSRSIYPLDNHEFHDQKYPATRPIKIVAFADGANYYVWDLGTKNYLTNIGVSGGDTGGGNVELTLSYQNDQSDIVIAKDSTVHSITYNGPY